MRKKIVLLVFIAAFCFGTMEVCLKLAGGSIDPIQITFLRFIGGGLLLLPFALNELKKRNIKTLTVRDVGYLFILGILCIPLSMLLFQIGLMRSSATLAAAIISMSPLANMLFAYLLVGERIKTGNIIAIIVQITGIIIMINPAKMTEGNTVLGIFLTVLGMILFSLYSVVGKLKVNYFGVVAQTALSFLLGSSIMLVYMVATGTPIISNINMGNIGPVLYSAVVVTGFGYLAYFKAIASSNVVTASVTFLIKPAIAVIAAAIVLGERLTASGIIGVAIVILASVINLRAMWATEGKSWKRKAILKTWKEEKRAELVENE